MAVKNGSGSVTNAGVYKHSWTLNEGDTGQPLNRGLFGDASVQVVGTFGGTTVTIEGSNDGGTTWATLTDPANAALSFTVTGLKQILEYVEIIRPNATGGSSTSVTIHIVGRKPT